MLASKNIIRTSFLEKRNDNCFLVVIVVVIVNVYVQLWLHSPKNVILWESQSNGVDQIDVPCNVITIKSTWLVDRFVLKHVQAKNILAVNCLAVLKAVSALTVFWWTKQAIVSHYHPVPAPMMTSTIPVDQPLSVVVMCAIVQMDLLSVRNLLQKNVNKNVHQSMKCNARRVKNAYQRCGGAIEFQIVPIKVMNKAVSMNARIKQASPVLMVNVLTRNLFVMVYHIVAMALMKSTAVIFHSSIRNFFHLCTVFLAYVQPCNEYTCKDSKKCIPKTWVCDGSIDCGFGDASDETADCSE